MKIPSRKLILPSAPNMPKNLTFGSYANADLDNQNFAGAKKVDFSTIQNLFMFNCDMAGVQNIKWPTISIGLYNIKNLPSKLSFKNLGHVGLDQIDLSGVEKITFNNVQIIHINDARNLPAQLDFSTAQHLNMFYTDFNGVKRIKWPKNATHVTIITPKNMSAEVKKEYDEYRQKLLQQQNEKKLNTL